MDEGGIDVDALFERYGPMVLRRADLFLGRHFTLSLDGRYLLRGHRSAPPSLPLLRDPLRAAAGNIPGRFDVHIGLAFGAGRP